MLIEKNPSGGTCLNVVYREKLLHSTEIYHELSSRIGISFGLEHDLSKLMKKKENVIDQLGQGVHFFVKKKSIHTGTAKLLRCNS